MGLRRGLRGRGYEHGDLPVHLLDTLLAGAQLALQLRVLLVQKGLMPPATATGDPPFRRELSRARSRLYGYLR